jgi:hypothetical protein
MRKSYRTQPALFALAELSDHPVMKSLDGLDALEHVAFNLLHSLLP